MFALDEAFWSGDKQAEGTLKDLITGRDHVIEHKGKEPYTVANKTRVAHHRQRRLDCPCLSR
jgi:hypothetical protein